MVDLTPERLAQLARARELALQARERIRNLSPEEKASHLTEKVATLLKKASAKQARGAKRAIPTAQPAEAKKHVEAQDGHASPKEPAVSPPEPAVSPPEPIISPPEPVIDALKPGILVPPVEDVPEAPAKRRLKRRIIIEQSSSDSGSAD
jgi:hypothetical protein